MDAERFDSLARSFVSPASRRSIVSLLGAAGIGGGLASILAADADAKKKKKKKKKCKPCRKKKKGKCKGKKPDGTPCGDGLVCENGQCVSATCDPACVPPDECVNGVCVPPVCDPACTPPEECVDGVCTCPSAQTCGEVCCGEELSCTNDYCLCENEFFCSCPADDELCGSPPEAQCCLDSDSCDPAGFCDTAACSADNVFCTPEVAFCNGSDSCACFAKLVDGTTVCAEISSFDGCPNTSECATDAQCVGGVCVDVSCCDPQQPNVGKCLPVCAAPLAGQSKRDGRSGGRGKRALPRP